MRGKQRRGTFCLAIEVETWEGASILKFPGAERYLSIFLLFQFCSWFCYHFDSDSGRVIFNKSPPFFFNLVYRLEYLFSEDCTWVDTWLNIWKYTICPFPCKSNIVVSISLLDPWHATIGAYSCYASSVCPDFWQMSDLSSEE